MYVTCKKIQRLNSD